MNNVHHRVQIYAETDTLRMETGLKIVREASSFS
jgi:hypothetical protein